MEKLLLIAHNITDFTNFLNFFRDFANSPTTQLHCNIYTNMIDLYKHRTRAILTSVVNTSIKVQTYRFAQNFTEKSSKKKFPCFCII